MVKLAIIGAGTMGQYSARVLASKVDEISVYDTIKSDSELREGLKGVQYNIQRELRSAVKNADFVLYCVPTDSVSNVMSESLPFCKRGAIISGQTSRKEPEKKAFDEYITKNPQSGLEMVTIHTMCNPKTSDPSREILAIIPNGCSQEAYEKALSFYGEISEHIERFRNVEEHDTVLANTQVNTSRTNLSIASTFANVGSLPWTNCSYSDGLDVMKFTLAMRTASLPPEIYRGIQFGNECGRNLVALSGNIGSAIAVMIKDPETFGSELENEILTTRIKLFGNERRETILRDEDVGRFGFGNSRPNSQIAIILYAMDDAQKGRKPFAYMKGTTPMHTAQLCLTDYLFNKPGLLEKSLNAIKEGINLYSYLI